ncbi:hypothetical protein [Nitrosococcus oceani]|uniref:Uncharacterized protein n=1 Tax=Nitrosococcus oceani C-27 TaxID=314279 RepID=A0A0E2Z9P1_9GAMM|nr:hypothetical protein [Nitrosococcus oceani]KFI20440.1 hypothetical protein IB75_03500 [Nitrosococcus oceani C-27]GEM19802.1 hypothetical protein NONS58_11990 [Nitrosococcus oceani]
MKTVKERPRLQKIFLAVFAIFAAAGHLLRSMLGMLAESAETKSDDAVSSAVRGGALNYKTGKLDDGTDATGWYEKD